MFSSEKFIEASRKFTCIRIESYENKESAELVKKLLHGRMANTAFVIMDPTGTKALTRSGRSPGMAMATTKGRPHTDDSQNDDMIAQMNQIAKRYRPSEQPSNAQLQDFHSLRQALNCAAADQRLLVVVKAEKPDRANVEQKLRSIFADDEIIGKFHLNFVDQKVDSNWRRVIQGAKDTPSIMIARASQFGLDAKTMEQLPLDASAKTIKSSLLASNRKFAKNEKRKNYEEHVRAGKSQRIVFENEISRKGAADSPRSKREKSGRRNR